MSSVWAELKRRNVVRVAILYVVASWLVLQVADVLFENLGVPEWAFGLVLALLIVFFLPVVIFSWVYELTPEGLRRESEIDRGQSIAADTGRRLNVVTIVVVVAGVGLLLVDRFLPDGAGDAQVPAAADAQTRTADATPPAATDGPPIVAVLPFKATGSDDGGFLAAGLHDDLLTKLAKLGAFRVISRTSMMEYAGTTRNMREIGAELGADFILEGGVQALEDRVRVNAQLIDALADEHIWADTYDRALSAASLFDIQAELALAITDQLKTTLSPEDKLLLDTVPTDNLDAYNAYLRGLNVWASTPGVGGEMSREAIEAFREAVRLDPDFAEAWARLATAHVQSGGNRYVKEASDAALTALAKARSLKPDLLEAELAWAEHQYRQEQEYARALATLEGLGERVAGNAEALSLMAFLNRRLGRYAEGYRILQSVWRLEPRTPQTYFVLIDFAMDNDDCEAAGRHAETLLDLDAESAGARGLVALYELECNGDARRAAELAGDGEVAWAPNFPIAMIAALSAHDKDLMLKHIAADWGERFDFEESWPIWRQLALNEHHTYLQSDPVLAGEALEEAGALLEDLGADPRIADSLEFAELNRHYHSAAGDTAETRNWIKIFRQRLRDETKGDEFREDQNRFADAYALAKVGLHDEAIAELEIMLSEPGGYRFPLVDSLPVFDVLHDHPEYLSFRERFGSDAN